MHGRTHARTDEQDKNSMPLATLRWAEEAQKLQIVAAILLTAGRTSCHPTKSVNILKRIILYNNKKNNNNLIHKEP